MKPIYPQPRSRQLFPNLLLRVAGLPLTQLDGLKVDVLRWRFDQQEAIRQRRLRAKPLVLDNLESCVPVLGPDIRQTVLALRRDWFNDRPGRVRHWDALLAALPGEVSQRVGWYRRLLEQEQRYHQTTARLYGLHSRLVRQRFQRLIGNESFQKGLTLSSLSLFQALPRYVATPPGQFRKNDYQIENGLLRYFSRMATKTSPYSTFTRLAFARLAERPSFPRVGPGKSQIRLNSQFLDAFRRILLLNQGLRTQVWLRVNPSLCDRNDKLSFVRKSAGEVACGRIPGGRMLRTILKLVGGGQLFVHLMDELTGRYRLKPLEVHRYLDKLSELGLIEADLGISPNDPDWAPKLRSWMQQHFWMAPAFLGQLTAVLQKLVEVAAELPVASACRRAALLGEVGGVLQALPRVHPAVAGLPDLFPPRPEQWFFEDVVLPQADVCLPAADGQQLTGALARLSDFVAPAPEKSEFLRIFRETADYDRDELTVTEFFEAWLKQHPEAASPDKKEPQENPAAWDELVRSMRRSGVVHVDTRTLPEPADEPASGGQFVQFWLDRRRRLHGVLSGLVPGYGRLFGRFLSYFDPALTADLRRCNEAAASGKRLLEVTDDAIHNANLHPPLLSGQVRTPGGHPIPGLDPVPLHELRVRETEPGRLSVLLPTGQPVELLNMGFQAQRSLFMYFLERLTAPTEGTGLASFCAYLSRVWNRRFAQAASPVQRIPRIVLDGRLVVQRRSWLVTVSDEPVLAETGDAAAFYTALTGWRRRWDIPGEVFVHLPESPAPDDRKPQYIHFESPLFLDLFRRLVRKTAGTGPLKLVEMYPDTSQALHFDGLPYGSEAVTVWYRNPGPEKTSAYFSYPVLQTATT